MKVLSGGLSQFEVLRDSQASELTTCLGHAELTGCVLELLAPRRETKRSFCRPCQAKNWRRAGPFFERPPGGRVLSVKGYGARSFFLQCFCKYSSSDSSTVEYRMP